MRDWLLLLLLRVLGAMLVGVGLSFRFAITDNFFEAVRLLTFVRPAGKWKTKGSNE